MRGREKKKVLKRKSNEYLGTKALFNFFLILKTKKTIIQYSKNVSDQLSKNICENKTGFR